MIRENKPNGRVILWELFYYKCYLPHLILNKMLSICEYIFLKQDTRTIWKTKHGTIQSRRKVVLMEKSDLYESNVFRSIISRMLLPQDVNGS